MPDNHDPLGQLWQEQPVEQPDFDAICNKWRLIKIKQRFYVLLDWMSVVFCIGVMVFYYDKLTDFLRVIFVVLTFVSIIWMAYNTWLRRFALSGAELTTDAYLTRLKKQLTNSIKIANLCKYSVWPMLAFAVLVEIGIIYFDGYDSEKIIRKLLFVFTYYGVMFTGLWVWASRRVKRFKRELMSLNELIRSNKLL
jgi:hypothetical protein